MDSTASKSTAVDLHLSIDQGNQDFYPIRAASSGPRPSASAKIPLAIIEDRIRPLATQLVGEQPFDEGCVRELGQLNFETLFPEQVRDLYRDAQARLTAGQHLRILLDIGPRELRQLPWELLYDPWLQEYLGDRDHTTQIRYVDSARRAGSPFSREMSGIKILVVASKPADIPPLQVEREVALIQDVAQNEIRQDWITFDFRDGTLAEIQKGLQGDPDVLHFIGHGGMQGDIPGIYLVDERGNARFANATYLENQLLIPIKDSLRRLRLMILNACETSETPESRQLDSLAQQLVAWSGSVVAMQYPISDSSSRAFSKALYQNLAQPAPLDIAVNAARQSIREGNPEKQRDWVTPVLISNGDNFEISRQLIPFKGPNYYTSSDQFWFHGREQQEQRLLEIAALCPVTVVCGPSTCGKTSFLLAGYLPEASRTRPVLYVSLAQDIENRMRDQLNSLLLSQKHQPLPDSSLATIFSGIEAQRFPPDLVLIIDRAEQSSLLSDATAELLRSIVRWAQNSYNMGAGGRLILGTRPDEDGKVPEFWRSLIPDLPSALLRLEMLDRDSMANVISEITEWAPSRFSTEAITRILQDLNYEKEPNMMSAQIVCLALYRRARELGRVVVAPELIDDPALLGVAGILNQDFDLSYKLSQPVYSGGELARIILNLFVQSQGDNAHPVSEAAINLRVEASPDEIRRTLDQLVEDGILVIEAVGKDARYELVHEALVKNIIQFPEMDLKLRRQEEIVENAGSGEQANLIPQQGGLEELSSGRDSGKLKLFPEQQKVVLRSALEAGFDVDHWIAHIANASLVLDVLSSSRLTDPARQRAVSPLSGLAARQDDIGKQARQVLLGKAENDPDPIVRRSAGRLLAPLLPDEELWAYYRTKPSPLSEPSIRAVAAIYDRAGQSLQGFDPLTRQKIQRATLSAALPEILKAAVQCATAIALGFTVVAGYNWYRNVLEAGATQLDWVALIPVGLLAFFLAFPGGVLTALGRDVASIYFGGRRARYAARGLLLGGAAGFGLSLFLLSGLSQAGSPSGFDLGPTGAGILLGLCICVGWLISLVKMPGNLSRLQPWAGLVGALLLGGAGLYSIEKVTGWWPDTYFLLTPMFTWELVVIGGLYGIFTAVGLYGSRKATEING